MVKTNHFCFTLFNYEQILDEVRAIARHERVQYLAWGRELCPSTGKPHLQGYIQLVRRTEDRTVQSMFPGQPRLFACNGSSDENEEYITKDQDVERFGELIHIPGKKKKKGGQYDSLMQDLKNGVWKNIREVASAYPTLWFKHHTAIEKTYYMFKKPTPTPFFGPFKWNVDHDWNTSLHLYGASGIGKTSYAKWLLPNALFVSHMDQLKNYTVDHDGIIFDDMSFAHMPREAQIHILDVDNERALHIRYGCAIIPARTKKIFLSNPEHIFLQWDEAIERRVTHIHLE